MKQGLYKYCYNIIKARYPLNDVICLLSENDFYNLVHDYIYYTDVYSEPLIIKFLIDNKDYIRFCLTKRRNVISICIVSIEDDDYLYYSDFDTNFEELLISIDNFYISKHIQ